jgi:DNA polymerase-1
MFFDANIYQDKLIDDALEILQNEPLLALDCETTGLDPRKKSIIMLQFGTPTGDQIVVDTRDYPVELFTNILTDPTKTFIGHNIKFDYNMLKPYRTLLCNVYDTMVAEKVIHNGAYNAIEAMKAKRFSLAGVYYHYFNKIIDKTTRDEFQTIKSQPFTHAQITYGANDVLYPFHIKEQQEKLIEQHDLNNCIKLENKLVLVLGDIEFNGFHINRDKWLRTVKRYTEKLKVTTKKLDNLLLETAPQYAIDAFQQDLFDSSYMNTRTCKVNWSSDKQVHDILSNIYNINPVDKYKRPSTGAAAIQALKEKHDITDLILQYREEEKVITSFGTEYLKKYVGDDNRVRTTYNQIIETGRMSSRKPNLQQIPDNDSFRKAFEAPEGRLISTADYSGQEARIIADKAQDENYINFFKSGDGDIHSFVSTTMFSAAFGKEFIVTKRNKNKAYRQKGKIINFFLSFGGSAYTLSQTLQLTEKEAQELIDAFYKGFPTLKIMFDKCKRFALNNGFIITNNVTKRIRWFPEWSRYMELKQIAYEEKRPEERSEMARIRGHIERRAMNTPIQGTAGDMTKTALVILRDKLIATGVLPYAEAEVKIVSVVHDECSLEIKESLAEKYSGIQQESMEEAGEVFVNSIPMIATPVIDKYWCH